MTGIEKLRRMVRLFDGCNETFNERWSVPELEKIYDAYKRAEYDYTPDTWTEEQLTAALEGVAPKFEE